MRLLLISSEFPPGPGGIGTHAYELARGLAARGWEPAVLTSQDYATAEEIDRFNAAQPFPVARFRPIAAPPLEALYREGVLGRSIRARRPSILLASGSRSVVLTACRWRGRNLPWVAVGHGTEFGPKDGAEARAVRWAFGQASLVVCVSEFTRRQMHEAGVQPRRDVVIPNGADPERFRRLPPEEARAVRRELGLEDARILITVGNVTERKGQDVVVRALPAVVRSEPRAHYVVVGLPTRGEALLELARSLGVADRVHVLGRMSADRVPKLLNAADIFVMTSRRTEEGDVEGYGIAAVEAGLCGLPSVVSGGSGLAEAVADGETGLVVPPDNPEATARAIFSLLADEEGRRMMGARAARRASEEQTWERCVVRYDEAMRPLGVSANASRASLGRRVAL
jgi:phosphatidylinositol alpha-1,6-mannosyltransferase